MFCFIDVSIQKKLEGHFTHGSEISTLLEQTQQALDELNFEESLSILEQAELLVLVS